MSYELPSTLERGSCQVPSSVSAAKNGGNEWVSSLRDNGLGNDSQYFDRIFVLFRPLHGQEEIKGKKDGRQVPKGIKKDPTLQSIPGVIVTTSVAEAYILRSYLLHVCCYITKYVDFPGFPNVVKSIDNFWMSGVKLGAESCQ